MIIRHKNITGPKTLTSLLTTCHNATRHITMTNKWKWCSDGTLNNTHVSYHSTISNNNSNSMNNNNNNNKILYATHVPTSFIQKGLIGLGSSLIAFMNPLRADMVAALGETTGTPSLKWMQSKMRASESGREILKTRPRLTNHPKFTSEYLSLLPSDTLGGAYYRFMSSHGFSASERPPVRFVDDEELAYIMMRYRETHDFYHVLADLPPTVLGELAIKAFEFVQLRLPMNALSGFAVLKLSSGDRSKYLNELLPWAWRCGVNSKFLMNFEFEKFIDQPLEDVRRQLLFEKAPPVPPV